MLISGSFLKIQNDKKLIEKLNDACDQIHFDIMDGNFTEKKTLELSLMENKLENINKIDIHLMVNDVKKYIKDVLKFNPSYITFHIEATKDPISLIDYIRSFNIKAGIAINPETDLDIIYPYLDNIDLVLIMSVHPGAGGQKFIDITDRIEALYDYRLKNNLSYKIEVDGGINDTTINKIKKADIAVIGSYITDSSDYKKKTLKLRGEIDE